MQTKPIYNSMKLYFSQKKKKKILEGNFLIKLLFFLNFIIKYLNMAYFKYLDEMKLYLKFIY